MPGPLVLPVPPDVLLYARPKVLEVGAGDLIEEDPEARDALDREVSRTGLFALEGLSLREKRPIMKQAVWPLDAGGSDFGWQR